MKKLKLTVKDPQGFPIQDLYFQLGANRWVSGSDGTLTMTYNSLDERVLLSGIMLKNTWLPISFLLDLPDHILVIGRNGIVFPPKDVRQTLVPEQTTEPVVATVEKNESQFSLWPIAAVIFGGYLLFGKAKETPKKTALK